MKFLEKNWNEFVDLSLARKKKDFVDLSNSYREEDGTGPSPFQLGPHEASKHQLLNCSTWAENSDILAQEACMGINVIGSSSRAHALAKAPI